MADVPTETEIATEAEAAGRWERKKRATRRAIKRAALTLAQERGVEHVTVEAISDAADVSPRTFFNYFRCKEDALIAETTETAAELRASIAARPADEPILAALRAAVTASQTLLSVTDRREESLARHRLVLDTPALQPRQLAQYAALERAIGTAVADRLGTNPDHDLHPALLACLAVAVIRVAMQRWAVDGGTSPTELVAAAFDLLEADLT